VTWWQKERRKKKDEKEAEAVKKALERKGDVGVVRTALLQILRTGKAVHHQSGRTANSLTVSSNVGDGIEAKEEINRNLSVPSGRRGEERRREKIAPKGSAFREGGCRTWCPGALGRVVELSGLRIGEVQQRGQLQNHTWRRMPYTWKGRAQQRHCSGHGAGERDYWTENTNTYINVRRENHAPEIGNTDLIR
jgi:hypothetical protein